MVMVVRMIVIMFFDLAECGFSCGSKAGLKPSLRSVSSILSTGVLLSASERFSLSRATDTLTSATPGRRESAVSILAAQSAAIHAADREGQGIVLLDARCSFRMVMTTAR